MLLNIYRNVWKLFLTASIRWSCFVQFVKKKNQLHLAWVLSHVGQTNQTSAHCCFCRRLKPRENLFLPLAARTPLLPINFIYIITNYDMKMWWRKTKQKINGKKFGNFFEIILRQWLCCSHLFRFYFFNFPVGSFFSAVIYVAHSELQKSLSWTLTKNYESWETDLNQELFHKKLLKSCQKWERKKIVWKNEIHNLHVKTCQSVCWSGCFDLKQIKIDSILNL